MMERLGILWHYTQARRRFTRWRDRASLAEWQDQQVQRHLHVVAAKSGYFRSIAQEQGIANWRNWPQQNKRQMMEHFDAWNTAGIRQEEAWQVATEAEHSRNFSQTLDGIAVGLSSGTSGSRGLFLASAAERSLWAGTLLARVLNGTLLHEHRAALFLRADSPLYQAVGSRRFQFAFFDLLEPTEQQWDRLRELRPTILAAPPSVLALAAARPDAASLLHEPRILLSVADVLSDADRRLIEAGFQVRAGQIYQATEGFLAATCPSGRLHWNEDAIVIQKEWLDAERTRFVPVITDFRRLTQPIIRYRLDDVIVADEGGPCPCGSAFETFSAIEGRCDDVLWLPSSRGEGQVRVFPDFVRRTMVLSVPPKVDYTVTQIAMDRWRLELSEDCDLGPVRRELQALCSRLGALVPVLERAPWRPVALATKRRRVRCELGKPP